MFTTKCLEGKTTTMSKLVAFRPTFNFRLLITACASNTFTSITSRAQLVSGCGDLLWGSSAAVCNWKVFCTRRSGDVMLFWNPASLLHDYLFLRRSEVRCWQSLNPQMFVEVTSDQSSAQEVFEGFATSNCPVTWTTQYLVKDQSTTCQSVNTKLRHNLCLN